MSSITYCIGKLSEAVSRPDGVHLMLSVKENGHIDEILGCISLISEKVDDSEYREVKNKLEQIRIHFKKYPSVKFKKPVVRKLVSEVSDQISAWKRVTLVNFDN